MTEDSLRTLICVIYVVIVSKTPNTCLCRNADVSLNACVLIDLVLKRGFVICSFNMAQIV